MSLHYQVAPPLSSAIAPPLAFTRSLSHYPEPAVHIMEAGTYGEESREIEDIGIELCKVGEVAL